MLFTTLVSLCLVLPSTAQANPVEFPYLVSLGAPYNTPLGIRAMLAKALGHGKHEQIDLAMRVLFEDGFSCVARDNGQTVNIADSHVTVNYLNQQKEARARSACAEDPFAGQRHFLVATDGHPESPEMDLGSQLQGALTGASPAQPHFTHFHAEIQPPSPVEVIEDAPLDQMNVTST